ncbi:MAG: TonB-dependent receptor [Steroidobacteraceae bacterium]
MEEIVVSARKRDENIIEVPQTITLLSEKSLTDYNIRSFNDYGNKVPNLAFMYGGSTTYGGPTSSRGVTIRGIAGANTTSFYIDDTAISSTQDPRIVDVERIEVMKGPQGTLFGASSIGGNVRIITKKPSLTDPDFKYQVSGGFTEHGGQPDFAVSLAGNTVLIPDKLAVRAMAFLNHESGYITKTWPVSTGDRLSRKGTGESYSYGASLSALAQITPNFSANLKLLAQTEDWPDGFLAVYRGRTKFDPDTLTIDRQADLPIYDKAQWFLPALTLNYDGNGWSLTSASSFFKQTRRESFDYTEGIRTSVFNRWGWVYTGTNVYANDVKYDQFQQELRLAIEPIHGISAIFGVYASRSTNTSGSPVRVVEGMGAAVGISGDNWEGGGRITDQNDTAIFGEIYYKPFEMLTLTAGARRYWLKQNMYNWVRGDVFANRDTYTVVREDGLSPKFSIMLEPAAATSIYANAAKGFRQGGPGTPNLVPLCDRDLNALGLTREKVGLGYESDSVWTYEVGAKRGVGAGLLLTGAVFQTNWDNIQQRVLLQSCGQSFVGNAGAARVRGFEFELNGQITADLSVRLGLGTTDAKITDDAGGATGQAKGSHIYGVPRKNATAGAMYTRHFSPDVSGFVTGDWSYVGDSVSANGGAAFPQVRGAYSMINMRIGGRWADNELSFYVNNLTDKRANYGDFRSLTGHNIVVNGQSVPNVLVAIARPRQYGLQFRHGF